VSAGADHIDSFTLPFSRVARVTDMGLLGFPEPRHDDGLVSNERHGNIRAIDEII
jgi:hypothetical protein